MGNKTSLKRALCKTADIVSTSNCKPVCASWLSRIFVFLWSVGLVMLFNTWPAVEQKSQQSQIKWNYQYSRKFCRETRWQISLLEYVIKSWRETCNILQVDIKQSKWEQKKLWKQIISADDKDRQEKKKQSLTLKLGSIYFEKVVNMFSKP